LWSKVLNIRARKQIFLARPLGILKDTTYSVGFTRRVGKTRLPLIPYLDLVPRILARAKSGKVHLIFGNERSGLSTADIVRCDSAAYLPSSPGFSSMNLSHAVMLVGYELQKAFLGKDHLGGVSAQRPERYPTRQAVEATFIEIDALLGKLGYRDYPRFKLLSSIRNNLRRMSKRTMPTIAEINMVRGILARLHQRLL
jgi:tRNA C32,U32 (ribose-2'-O)-methylase TrmJ